MKITTNPRLHDYDIRWGGPKGDQLIMFTRYKNHCFEGWVSLENLEKAEAEGIISWDESGHPVIKFPVDQSKPKAS